MDVASVLLAAQSPDASVRQPAEAQIEAAKASNLVRAACRSRQPSPLSRQPRSSLSPTHES